MPSLDRRSSPSSRTVPAPFTRRRAASVVAALSITAAALGGCAAEAVGLDGAPDCDAVVARLTDCDVDLPADALESCSAMTDSERMAAWSAVADRSCNGLSQALGGAPHCEEHSQCDAYHYCYWGPLSFFTQHGECRPKKGEAMNCTEAAECTSGICQKPWGSPILMTCGGKRIEQLTGN